MPSVPRKAPATPRKAAAAVEASPASTRLTREDWLDAAFQATIAGGFGAVRVLTLADALGVSHGRSRGFEPTAPVCTAFESTRPGQIS